VFAGAWLSGWLAEISADVREAVAHHRRFTTMHYINPRTFTLACFAVGLFLLLDQKSKMYFLMTFGIWCKALTDVIHHYPPYLHLATSEMWCWSGGRWILTELFLRCSIVYHYNGAQCYEQFLQVGRLDRTLILFGLAVCLPTASVSSVFMVLYIYIYIYIYILKIIFFTFFTLPFS